MKTMLDLTDSFPMRFDVDRMREELRLLDDHPWVEHYDKSLADGWSAVPLVSRDGSMDGVESQRLGKWGHYQRTKIVDSLPYFREILDAFQCPNGRIRIMKMMPGTVIRPHRDVFREVACFAFNQVRLHIPIVTNDKVVFCVGGENLQLRPGRLYYVNFSKVHHVCNDGDTPRIHLVLDLKVNKFLRDVFPKLTPFERCENLFFRWALPPVWWSHYFATRPSNWFWKLYNDSILQRLRHQLFKAKTRRHAAVQISEQR